ncbi:MAG: FKBP-type peptidyl-prolyl cis-trans isomerase [Acidobacteriota bacterium]
MTNLFPRLLHTSLVLSMLLALPACAAETNEGEGAEGAAAETEATVDKDLLYNLGVSIGQSLAPLEVTEAELAEISKGFEDASLGNATFDPQEWQAKLQTYAQGKLNTAAEANAARSAEYVTGEAAKEGAEQTESGLVYFELAAGEGASPSATDRVKVHYTGTFPDGNKFDSSVDRGEPAEFFLNQVISCWTEGVQKMQVGGKSRLVCPADIAYGTRGRPPQIPGNQVLIFEIELLDIVQDEAASAPSE